MNKPGKDKFGKDLKPSETEPICLVSYEIARILVAGGPDTRPGFWKAYRNELALNQKTNYNNYHIKLCKDHLVSPLLKLKEPIYYRDNRLTTEKEVPSQ